MIYGYSIAVQQVDGGEGTEQAWRAFAIRDAGPGEDRPQTWFAYGPTEKAAMLAVAGKIEYRS